MAKDATGYIARARAKIAQNGMMVTVCKPESDSGYDPVLGKSDEVYAEQAVMAVMLKVTAQDIASGLVQAGDARLLLAGDELASVPDSRFIVLIGEQEWRVVSAEAVMPFGEPLLWKLVIRRS